MKYLFYFDVWESFGNSFGLCFLVDFYSLIFFRVVCLISGVVFSYSIFYMGFLVTKRFFFITLLFVISIAVLIFSSNLFSIMLGWDGLGLTSFLLVNYYLNEVTIKSSILTIIINRLGDAGMVIFISFLLLNRHNYDIFRGLIGNKYLFLLFMFSCFTKSAQYPFISWLPAAITAPTPISSLVHSSTLVTAGVYLLIRLNYIFINELLIDFLKVMGVFTILLGGIMAIIETDFKKVIAFSTLRQLGLMVFILGFGEYYLSFFQLITHAIFKSFLFICSGVIIRLSYGNQDSRIMGLNGSTNTTLIMFIGFCCLNLRGFPLLMGFFSKDLILESVFSFNINFFIIILFYLRCLFSVIYRMKIFFNFLYFIKFGFSVKYSVNFNSELYILFFLFLFLRLWGLIIEEFMLTDDLFRYEQDLKILDFSLILFGFIFYFITKDFFNKNDFWSIISSFMVSYLFFFKNKFFLNILGNVNFFMGYIRTNISFSLLVNSIENQNYYPSYHKNSFRFGLLFLIFVFFNLFLFFILFCF